MRGCAGPVLCDTWLESQGLAGAGVLRCAMCTAAQHLRQQHACMHARMQARARKVAQGCRRAARPNTPARRCAHTLPRSPPRAGCRARRAAGGVHLHGPRVLPEAQAHGAGQDARARQGAARGAHAPADRGALARRRPAPGCASVRGACCVGCVDACSAAHVRSACLRSIMRRRGCKHVHASMHARALNQPPPPPPLPPPAPACAQARWSATA